VIPVVLGIVGAILALLGGSAYGVDITDPCIYLPVVVLLIGVVFIIAMVLGVFSGGIRALLGFVGLVLVVSALIFGGAMTHYCRLARSDGDVWITVHYEDGTSETIPPRLAQVVIRTRENKTIEQITWHYRLSTLRSRVEKISTVEFQLVWFRPALQDEVIWSHEVKVQGDSGNYTMSYEELKDAVSEYVDEPLTSDEKTVTCHIKAVFHGESGYTSEVEHRKALDLMVRWPYIGAIEIEGVSWHAATLSVISASTMQVGETELSAQFLVSLAALGCQATALALTIWEMEEDED